MTGCKTPAARASPAMPLRYIEAARIANEGVRLDG